MTLRDKFLNSPCEKGYINTNIYRAENNVKIADDYAIEFASWIQFHSELWIRYNRRELLQIFKKENGL